MLDANVVETCKIEICGDCRSVIECDEWSGIPDGDLADFTLRYKEGIERELGGRRGNIVVGNGDGWFGQMPCEVCRDRFHGTRFEAEILFDGFPIGQRVEAHPGCDCWIMGDRFGTVVKNGRKYVHVKMDRSQRVRKFTPDRIFHR